ncbi:hypothetical protein F4Z99_13735 [Candidatus Poribacteria bacterium]|nr:hypothetical protein [Candidatus Poribacteria bacterium]MYA99194.1 hypothetical protein [Candidatus Poribacteria bacterium]
MFIQEITPCHEAPIQTDTAKPNTQNRLCIIIRWVLSVCADFRFLGPLEDSGLETVLVGIRSTQPTGLIGLNSDCRDFSHYHDKISDGK